MVSAKQTPRPRKAEQLPDPEVDAAAETEVASEVVSEGEPLPTHLAMRHSEGGSSDSLEADADGIVLVPVADIETALSHGFVPAASDE